MACSLMACQSYDVPFCSEYADGRVCGSSRAPGCDPQTKPGSIDHTDPELQRVLLDMVTSWYDQCPSASAATCTPTESRVECVVWARPIDCLVERPGYGLGRPFLDAHQALQASARVEVGPDWIGASPWLPSWLAHTSAVRNHGKAPLAVVRAGERTLHKDVFTSDDNGVNGS